MTWTGELVGLENVTVPAGTYNNARRYSSTLTSSTTYLGITTTYTLKEDVWLAENVGLVKISELESMGGLSLYESDEQLTAFSIP